MTKRLLTLKEFASELSISEALARKWQRNGKLRVTKLGRCVRLPQEEIERLKSQRLDGLRVALQQPGSLARFVTTPK